MTPTPCTRDGRPAAADDVRRLGARPARGRGGPHRGAHLLRPTRPEPPEAVVEAHPRRRCAAPGAARSAVADLDVGRGHDPLRRAGQHRRQRGGRRPQAGHDLGAGRRRATRPARSAPSTTRCPPARRWCCTPTASPSAGAPRAATAVRRRPARSSRPACCATPGSATTTPASSVGQTAAMTRPARRAAPAAAGRASPTCSPSASAAGKWPRRSAWRARTRSGSPPCSATSAGSWSAPAVQAHGQLRSLAGGRPPRRRVQLARQRRRDGARHRPRHRGTG